ncbi:transposase [Sinorhizobium meliloti]
MQWLKIASLLPGKAGDPGRTGSDNRLSINGCLWILRSGAHWRDLRGALWQVEDCPSPVSSRWCHAGSWERVFDTLAADRDNQYLIIDSTIVRCPSAGGIRKKGPRIRLWGVPEVD